MKFVITMECDYRPAGELKSLHGMLRDLDGSTVSLNSFLSIIRNLNSIVDEINNQKPVQFTYIDISLILPSLIHRIKFSTNYYTATLVAKQFN